MSRAWRGRMPDPFGPLNGRAHLTASLRTSPKEQAIQKRQIAGRAQPSTSLVFFFPLFVYVLPRKQPYGKAETGS
jgi:hypothetical protein